MKQKITFIICLLFGLMFINSGLNKFFNYIPLPDDLPAEMITIGTAILQIGWLLPLIAIVEITCGALYVIPKLRPLAAIIIFPIIVGIILTHITADLSGLPLALILLAINVFIIYENREKYLPMIK